SGRQLSRCLQPDLVQHYSKINQTFRLNVIAARVLSLHLKESFWHCGKVLTVHLTFFFSSRRRHTRWPRDWSSDVCSSDLRPIADRGHALRLAEHLHHGGNVGVIQCLHIGLHELLGGDTRLGRSQLGGGDAQRGNEEKRCENERC